MRYRCVPRLATIASVLLLISCGLPQETGTEHVGVYEREFASLDSALFPRNIKMLRAAAPVPRYMVSGLTTPIPKHLANAYVITGTYRLELESSSRATYRMVEHSVRLSETIRVELTGTWQVGDSGEVELLLRSEGGHSGLVQTSAILIDDVLWVGAVGGGATVLGGGYPRRQ